ncbi:MAG: TonB-dependent receptor, partial [Gammaproteobacteria bacterium]
MSAALSCRTPLLALIALLGFPAGAALAQLPDYTGRPIVDLIDALRDQGARIAYSTDSLPARLRVNATPDTEDRLEALREILAPHGLDVEVGPRDTWLIVRRPRATSPLATVPTDSGPTLIPPSLETVIVTASRYPIERRSAVSATDFGRHTLETTPALGQDPLRITHRLPGVASDQLSSRMHIRGGDLDEVLLRLDGIRLYSPYHLKDFQNIFSSINPRVIESMDVRTGGYEARFGDRLSGVVDMSSITPSEYRHHELGVSFLETSVLSSGLFGDGAGSWVTSLRRGNLDVLAEAADSDIGKPQYVDFFNKLEFSLSPRLRIETAILSLDDKITLKDGDQADATADYDDSYIWTTLTRSGEGGLESSFTVSSTNLHRTRAGDLNEADRVIGSLSEMSRFDRLALSAEWSLQPIEALYINWGAEYAKSDSRHRFAADRSFLRPITATELDGSNSPPVGADLRLRQIKRAAHVSFRYQPIQRFVTEIGARWDEQTLTGESQISPRLNARFDISARTRLRAGWGEFAQSGSLSELAIADGITAPGPTEKSTHTVFGIEHAFHDTILARLEVYEKRANRLTPRFENLFERVSLVPELLPDRFRIAPLSAETRGIEFGIDGGLDRFSWWTNVALARTRERLASGTFRRSWDERRAI